MSFCFRSRSEPTGSRLAGSFPAKLGPVSFGALAMLVSAIVVGAPQVTPWPTPARSPTPAAEAACTGPVQAPEVIRRVEPVYPDALKDKGVKGTVVLRGVLGSDGRVDDIRVLDSPSETLTRAATKAFRQWRYKPAMCDGRPHRVHVTAKMTFHGK